MGRAVQDKCCELGDCTTGSGNAWLNYFLQSLHCDDIIHYCYLRASEHPGVDLSNAFCATWSMNSIIIKWWRWGSWSRWCNKNIISLKKTFPLTTRAKAQVALDLTKFCCFIIFLYQNCCCSSFNQYFWSTCKYSGKSGLAATGPDVATAPATKWGYFNLVAILLFFW